MRRTRLFLFRFVLGLWLVLFGAFIFLLAFEARGGGVHTPFAGIAIRADSGVAPIPNRVFTCTEAERQFQCQADIQGRPLRLVLVSDGLPNSERYNCQAQYDGRSVGCKSKGSDYAPMLSESFEVGRLELSPQQLQAVRQKYWGVRMLFALRERRLLQISGGLSIAGGIIAACLAWYHPNWLSEGLASIGWGLVVARLVGESLGGILFETVARYGIAVDTWIRIVNSATVGMGIGSAIAVAFLLKRRRTNPVTKTISIVSSGFGTLLIVGYGLVIMLLSSGFVD